MKKGALHLLSPVAAIALAISVAVALPQTASANTGAGAAILNVVTVNYKDASGVTAYAETATVSVTVLLVQAAPVVSAPIDQAIASGGTITYAYTVTANANGSDVYPVSAVAGAATNATGITITPSVASLTLGSSVVLSNTANTVNIPAGSETNLAVNDIVVINGVDYKVSTVVVGTQQVVTNASPTDGIAGTTTTPEVNTVITLIANPLGSNIAPAFAVLPAGTLIAEQGAFTMTVTATAGPATGNGTVPVTVSVGTVPATDATVSTFNGASLTITKEVSIDGGATFAASGSGAPGSTLTYRVTVTNAGAGSATAVVITDPMPAYTTYVANSAKSDPTATTYALAATVLTDSPLLPVVDGYDFTGTTATLNVGTLGAATTIVLYYQVTIQ